MKTTIIYFSPTGTSAKIASGIARGLDGCEVEMIDITRSSAPAMSLANDELLVAVSPVYGGHIPAIVRERMAAVAGDSTPAVAVTVYGNRAFEKAVTDLGDFLGERGFTATAGGAFVGGHSYSTEATPIAVSRPDSRDMADAEAFGHAIAAKLASGCAMPADLAALTDDPIPAEALENFITFVRGYQKQQTEHPVKLFPTLDTDLCGSCGVCADVCPTSAIDPESFETDPARCIKCCACVKSCTNGARTFNSPFAPVLSANFANRKEPKWVI